jgi:ankyrin repeat protein
MCGNRRPIVAATLIIVLAHAVSPSAQAPESARATPQPPANPTDPKADALWQAARKGDAPAVEKLLDEGVDVNTKFRYGTTALSYACDRGNLEVVRLLLERGADPNVKDTFYGATPLGWASSPAQARKPEHAEIVRLLLKRGASGQQDALLSAVSEGDGPMTRVILEHGGLSTAALADALEAANDGKRASIIAILEAAGARPHPVVALTEQQLSRCAGTYSDGNISLTYAVSDGKLEGGSGGPVRRLVPRSETTFAVEGVPGLTIAFTFGGDKATSLTVNQGDSATAFKRVEER